MFAKLRSRVNRYQLTHSIEKGCKNIWPKIALQRLHCWNGHNDLVVILRKKTTFFNILTNMFWQLNLIWFLAKCVAAEISILSPQKELEIPGVEELSEGWKALRKNPFQGKMWIFSETTQWIYLLLKGGEGGGCGGVRFDIQERSQVVFNW